MFGLLRLLAYALAGFAIFEFGKGLFGVEEGRTGPKGQNRQRQRGQQGQQGRVGQKGAMAKSPG